MINFTHEFCLFLVLPTVLQTRITWILSVRKAAICHNSLHGIIQHSVLLGVHQYEHFIVFGCQSEDSAEDLKKLDVSNGD